MKEKIHEDQIIFDKKIQIKELEKKLKETEQKLNK